MLHSYVHGGDCVAIQYNDQTLVINQTPDNMQQAARIDQHPGKIFVSFDSVATGQYGDFLIEKLDGAIMITVAAVCILYHYRNPNFDVDRVSDLLFVDMSIGWDAACTVAARVKGKTIVPIAVTSSDDPIGFCREVLLHNRGVPKYLKPGQYVVH